MCRSVLQVKRCPVLSIFGTTLHRKLVSGLYFNFCTVLFVVYIVLHPWGGTSWPYTLHMWERRLNAVTFHSLWVIIVRQKMPSSFNAADACWADNIRYFPATWSQEFRSNLAWDRLLKVLILISWVPEMVIQWYLAAADSTSCPSCMRFERSLTFIIVTLQL